MAGKERTTWVGVIGRNFITNWLTFLNSSFVNYAYIIQQLNYIKLLYPSLFINFQVIPEIK